MKKIIFWGILVVFTLAGCLITAELVLRYVYAQGEKTSQRGGGESIEYVHRDGYYVYPSLSHKVFNNEDVTEISIDSDEEGLRNPKGYLQKSSIVVLGDSFATAVNTPENLTLVGKLRQSGIAAYNAGMDGYSTFNSIYLLQRLLQNVKPRVVLLMFYLGNDFHDNYFESNLSKSYTALYANRKEGVSQLNRLCSKSYLCKALYIKVYQGMVQGKEREKMASYSLAEIASYLNNYDSKMEEAVSKTRTAFTELRRLASQHDFQVWIIGIPSKAQVMSSFHEISGFDIDQRSKNAALDAISAGYSFDKPDSIAEKLAHETGIRYVSLLKLFRENKERKIYYQIDPHWTVNGQDLAVKHLIQTIFSRREE